MRDLFAFILLGLFFIATDVNRSQAAQQDQGEVLAGFWEGDIVFRGAALPVRISFDERDGKLSADLDIPTLIYAGQSIPVAPLENNTYILSFPFGIGEVSIHLNGKGTIQAQQDEITLALTPAAAPPYTKKEISFGAFNPALSGTLYLPKVEGPVPLVILIAGSGKANRQQWSYASWADFYARQGIAALVYDRRNETYLLENGIMMGMQDHAADLAAAVDVLRTIPEIDPDRIGAASHSRGGWIAMALGKLIPDLAFMIFLSPAPVTPAEQNVDANLTGMDQDGLPSTDLEAARNYFRLYFYTARTGLGWDLLESEIQKAQETPWGQYVDQPRNPGDLLWWRANMSFDAAGHLRELEMPVLALWGGADFLTPYAGYEGLFKFNLELGGNKDVTTRVYPGADHRLEVDPGVSQDGDWYWFGMAPGVLQTLSEWIKAKTGDSRH